MNLVNLLITFPYFKGALLKVAIEQHSKVRLVVDSGAFTAWRLGKTVKLDDYCHFLDTLPIKPWRYFSLDVVGDPGGSMRNYETMLQRGYKPVPIFTRGEDPSVLDDYYKTSDVVAIGGLVGTKGSQGFVNGIMKHVAKRKVHWLGFTNMDYLKFYRPYMCDTSSWESGARFACLNLYVGHGQFIAIKKSEFVNKPNDKVINAVKRLGLDPYQLGRTANWHGGYSLSRTLCAASAVALSADIERNIGTKYFISVAAEIGYNLLIRAAANQQNEMRRAA